MTHFLFVMFLFWFIAAGLVAIDIAVDEVRPARVRANRRNQRR